MALAQSDIGIELWASSTGTAGTFTELVAVTGVPATGSAQGKLEATELSSTKKQYIADREDLPDLEFTYNHLEANYTLVEAVCGQAYHFLIVYGDGTGALIVGEGNTWVDAVSRGSVVQAKLNIVPESIEYQTIAEVAVLVAVGS